MPHDILPGESDSFLRAGRIFFGGKSSESLSNGQQMKQDFAKSIVANIAVLGCTVWGSRVFGVGEEHSVSVFWFLMVVQVLANELWLYAAAVPALLTALFSKKRSEERAVLLVLKLTSFVLIAAPAALYAALYLLRPLIGEWCLAELGVPLSGTMMLISLLGQMFLFVFAWMVGLCPVCPSAAFNMLDNHLDNPKRS